MSMHSLLRKISMVDPLCSYAFIVVYIVRLDQPIGILIKVVVIRCCLESLEKYYRKKVRDNMDAYNTDSTANLEPNEEKDGVRNLISVIAPKCNLSMHGM